MVAAVAVVVDLIQHLLVEQVVQVEDLLETLLPVQHLKEMWEEMVMDLPQVMLMVVEAAAAAVLVADQVDLLLLVRLVGQEFVYHLLSKILPKHLDQEPHQLQVEV
jgi:hypothetical protein